MTFVVGFHCFDGLVLCADSEESDGLNKKYVDKLYGIKMSPEWELCFGGAGNAIGIDKFNFNLSAVLAESTIDQITTELNVESVLKHMAGSYPDLGFDILLAQSEIEKGETFLYRTHGGESSLRPIEYGSFACIGMDTSLAEFFLLNTFDAFTEVKEAMRLGIWVTAMSKIHTHGVSGPSMAFTYKKGDKEGWKRHFTHEISQIENTYPIMELQKILRGYWIENNPDIYKIVDGQAVRGEPNK
jgi:20S proteasome alpha/beta subunit